MTCLAVRLARFEISRVCVAFVGLETGRLLDCLRVGGWLARLLARRLRSWRRIAGLEFVMCQLCIPEPWRCRDLMRSRAPGAMAL